MIEHTNDPIELFHEYTYSGYPVACAVVLATLDMGLMVRANGDTLAFSPPLIVKENHIYEMFKTIKKALEQAD